MCSNVGRTGSSATPLGDLASRLAAAIDACAVAASHPDGADRDAEARVAARLAAAWAMLAGADPDLAARIARYCDPPGQATGLAPGRAR